jgi:hypothetical protein
VESLRLRAAMSCRSRGLSHGDGGACVRMGSWRMRDGILRTQDPGNKDFKDNDIGAIRAHRYRPTDSPATRLKSCSFVLHPYAAPAPCGP